MHGHATIHMLTLTCTSQFTVKKHQPGFGLRVDDDVRSSDSADGSKEADEAEKAKAEKAEAKAERGTSYLDTTVFIVY